MKKTWTCGEKVVQQTLFGAYVEDYNAVGNPDEDLCITGCLVTDWFFIFKHNHFQS